MVAVKRFFSTHRAISREAENPRRTRGMPITAIFRRGIPRDPKRVTQIATARPRAVALKNP